MADKRNQDLNSARGAKKDEFYTQLTDIEKELRHYKAHFKGATVYCNCDDPNVSNFTNFFKKNFEKYDLKKLITTCYKNDNLDLFSKNKSKRAGFLEYVGAVQADQVANAKTSLKGDGDFRSEESIELLKQADIVVTNPPFSLFREYISQLMKFNKKFLIIGNLNAITYKEVFNLIADNKLWFGPSIRSGDREFGVPDSYPLNASGTRVDADGKKYIRVKGVRWFTNLDFKERHEDLILYKNYTENDYPTYVNFDGIDVGKTKEIPMDYDGAMGVPITFLDKWNPAQFQIIGSSRTLSKPMSEFADSGSYSQGGPRFYLKNTDGGYRRLYDRIVIRRIK